ncbi:hypothetical protein GGX14DRAFT_403744 [Mycena pura]|uniref:Uncharacterized protein n=1 Tax=Mycena pura TaxID=153505 RepID=A0AAD6UVP1_9AGAR|nr:hypothetical protein GGX14DRAFT_403744 [Mycena pura]
MLLSCGRKIPSAIRPKKAISHGGGGGGERQAEVETLRQLLSYVLRVCYVHFERFLSTTDHTCIKLLVDCKTVAAYNQWSFKMLQIPDPQRRLSAHIHPSCQWFQNKVMHTHLLPGLVQPLSWISVDNWHLLPPNTNYGEGQHHWNNLQTGIRRTRRNDRGVSPRARYPVIFAICTTTPSTALRSYGPRLILATRVMTLAKLFKGRRGIYPVTPPMVSHHIYTSPLVVGGLVPYAGFGRQLDNYFTKTLNHIPEKIEKFRTTLIWEVLSGKWAKRDVTLWPVLLPRRSGDFCVQPELTWRGSPECLGYRDSLPLGPGRTYAGETRQNPPLESN